MRKLQNVMMRLRSEPKPIKFILSRILWKTGLCRLFLIKRNNYQLKFYPSALSCGLWYDNQARNEDEVFINDYLKSGDTIIDIGANIGSLAILSAIKAGINGKVYAFEPHPTIYRYLKSNIKLNNLNNIHAYNFALGNENGLISFTNYKSDDMNSVTHSHNPKSIHINVEKLDNVITNTNQNIALIKIDVEGYEKFILEGSCRLLQNTECIYFETSEDHFKHFNYSSKDLFNLIRSFGFNIYTFLHSNVLSAIDKDHISINGENLVAIKNEEKFIQRTGYSIMNSA